MLSLSSPCLKDLASLIFGLILRWSPKGSAEHPANRSWALLPCFSPLPRGAGLSSCGVVVFHPACSGGCAARVEEARQQCASHMVSCHSQKPSQAQLPRLNVNDKEERQCRLTSPGHCPEPIRTSGRSLKAEALEHPWA